MISKVLSIAAVSLVAAATVGAQGTAKPAGQASGTQASTAPAAPADAASRKAAEEFARHFFAAYDARNVAAAKALLAPEMKILAFDGQERNVAALLEGISASSSPPPKRELGNFEVFDAGSVIVVAFDDRVTAQGAGAPSGSIRYRESWVLKPTPAGLRAIWATYGAEGVEPASNDSHPAVESPPAALSAQDQAAADFIAHFFDAYIGRRLEEMKALFLPGSRFLLDTAEETSIDAMAAQLAASPQPTYKYERPKNGGHFLDHFEFLHAGSATVVAFDNHVTAWRTGHPELEEHTFRESWVLKQTPDGLRAVWSALTIYGTVLPHGTAAEKSGG
jgi:ketosteroid isomerase-like protein